MKFYDRESEIEILRQNWEQSESESRFTVLTGRRRIGKTSLLLQLEKEQRMLYLYVSKDNERVLAEKFQRTSEVLKRRTSEVLKIRTAEVLKIRTAEVLKFKTAEVLKIIIGKRCRSVSIRSLFLGVKL